MRYIADLHIHSKYSRACSKELEIPKINEWAKIKGIQIIGTADFTHPGWLRHLKENLTADKPGLFKVKGEKESVSFMLTSEVSCIYKQGDKVRRLHICIFAPDFKTVDEINSALEKRGVNLKSDGRPIMGLHADELSKIILDINDKCLIIPAHAWTPWFSVFGSYSGFDSLAECFGKMAPYIYSIETGLSSDPPMNWRISALDKITLISNSDAHSPANLGREANVFDIPENELSYDEIYRIIKEKDKKRFLYTIEFFPQEGKYHFDGHRDCKIQFSPKQTKKNKGICPVCKKPLTIGVDNRLDQLSDREVGFKFDTVGYKSLVPLPEIIAEVLEVGKASKKVNKIYHELVQKAGSEFGILLDLSLEELGKIALPEIVLGIKNVREGNIEISAGYDGVYGTVKVFKDLKKLKPKQKSLF
jgi:uncharacterized protein (TIGR00375 family)